MNTPKAFAILGPTAGGKTALALKIAEALPVEIISLDSALVYRDMDIGTAKPTAAELEAVPHHLIDIIPPTESYSAAEFVGDCVRLAEEIHARGRLPLIVGGTMMYFHALTEGLNDLPEADAAVRARLQEEKQRYGLAHLYQSLQAIDPETADRLKPNDSQRIERALEVYRLTGKPLSAHFAEKADYTPPLDLCTTALIPENRALLHENIARRFTQMLEQGFIDEMRALRQKYPVFYNINAKGTKDSNSMPKELASVKEMPNQLVEVALTFDKAYTYKEIQKLIPNNLKINWYWIGSQSEDGEKGIELFSDPQFTYGANASLLFTYDLDFRKKAKEAKKEQQTFLDYLKKADKNLFPSLSGYNMYNDVDAYLKSALVD